MKKILTFRIKGGKWHFPASIYNFAAASWPENDPRLETCRRFGQILVREKCLAVTMVGTFLVYPEVRLLTAEEIADLTKAGRMCRMCLRDYRLNPQGLAENNNGYLITEDVLDRVGIELQQPQVATPELTIHVASKPCPICNAAMASELPTSGDRLIELGMGQGTIRACEGCLRSALALAHDLPDGMTITLRKGK